MAAAAEEVGPVVAEDGEVGADCPPPPPTEDPAEVRVGEEEEEGAAAAAGEKAGAEVCGRGRD